MMRAPLSWLREYVTVDATADEIAYRLAISSLEVERASKPASPTPTEISAALVGRVLEAAPHPNADRLRVPGGRRRRRRAADRLRRMELRPVRRSRSRSRSVSPDPGRAARRTRLRGQLGGE